METELFYYIDNQCNILHEIHDYIQNGVTWSWVPFVYTCKDFKKNFSQHFIDKDNFLRSLQEHFRETHLHLYKFPSMTFYTWHKDKNVGCSLNMVLDDYNSKTIFMPDPGKKLLNDIVELKYQKYKWYLFNSQITHSVINLDTRDRILLTLTFPLKTKFCQVKSFIQTDLNI